jgi:hypothetical protein
MSSESEDEEAETATLSTAEVSTEKTEGPKQYQPVEDLPFFPVRGDKGGALALDPEDAE